MKKVDGHETEEALDVKVREGPSGQRLRFIVSDKNKRKSEIEIEKCFATCHGVEVPTTTIKAEVDSDGPAITGDI